MVANISQAIAAYGEAASRGAGGAAGTAAQTDQQAPNFSELVTSSINNAIDVHRSSEALSTGAVEGKANLTDVVTAVSNAEVTLRTVVSVRDRAVEAYQQIMRMPI